MQCIQRVEQYLLENHFEKPITTQILMCPPAKDFFLIVEFLLRRIDPHFAFKDPKKPEEETPALFKVLKYPFGFTPRSLHSVATPHAWPTFLAVVNWLIELLTYNDYAQMHQAEMIEEDRTSQEAMRYAFFDFVAQAYQAFMSFDDKETQLEADFVRSLCERNQERQDATERLQDQTKEVQAETERLRTSDTRITTLAKTVETQARELEKLKAEVAKCKEAKEATAAKLVEYKMQGQTEREAVDRLQYELTKLDAMLRHQMEQNLDVDKLNNEKQALKQSIMTVLHHRDEVEKASSALEMEISEKFREVDRGVSQLNQLLDSTGIVKTLGEELRVMPQSPTILSMDMKKSVKPVLLAFLEEQRKLRQQNQPILVETQLKADQRQEEVATKRTLLTELKARYERESANLNSLKESFQQPRKALEQSITELEHEISQLSLSSKDLIMSRKKDKLDLIQRIDRKKLAFEKVESDLTAQLERYIDWIVTHHENISTKLRNLEEALIRQSSP